MRVTNNMITANTKSNINANKVLVDKYNTQMTTQKKIVKLTGERIRGLSNVWIKLSYTISIHMKIHYC